MVEFKIKRGINVSHWLTNRWLSVYRRHAYFTETDIRYIRDFGFDHIRLPIAEQLMWKRSGERHSETFALLGAAINWALAANLRVIVCLHSLRSHDPGRLSTARLFSDPNEEERFQQLWSDLSRYLKPYPNESVSYELLNEPFASNDLDWNRVSHGVYREIRREEPERPVFLGSNKHQIPLFDTLDIPEQDPNIVLTFHFYYPILLTHHRAAWVKEGMYKGPISYPGRPVPTGAVHSLKEPLRSYIEKANLPFNRHVLKQFLRGVLETRKMAGLPVHCGEFGCIDEVNLDSRIRWCGDVVHNLEKAGIPWSYWDWKGDFGILDQSTWRPCGLDPALGLKAVTRRRWQRPIEVDFSSRLARFLRRTLRLSLLRHRFFRQGP